MKHSGSIVSIGKDAKTFVPAEASSVSVALPSARVVEGAIVARPLVTAALSADHRVSDGHRGELFLAAVDNLLQTPERL